MKGLLQPIERTLDLLKKADAQLAIPQDQIKYAQFWFLNITPLDNVAFKHLLSNDNRHINEKIFKAFEIWQKDLSISSLQNRIIIYLCCKQYKEALSFAEILYRRFGDKYISTISPTSTVSMTGVELSHVFLDALGDEIDMEELYPLIKNAEWITYVKSQIVTPNANIIIAEINRARNVNMNDPNARLSAGIALSNVTKEPLARIKRFLSDDDAQLQMIADKLGTEILQCAIDYCIKSKDDNKEKTALDLMKYAQSVVVGVLAKQRCEEQVKILQKIIDEQPPSEVMGEDRAINAELSKYDKLPHTISNAMNLLYNTKPYLQRIKKKLGGTNDYYLKKSTQVVRIALNIVIEEVNSTLSPLEQYISEINNTHLMLRYNKHYDGVELAMLQTNAINSLRDALDAFHQMDKFDMEFDFNVHYRKQENILRSIYGRLKKDYIKTATSNEGCLNTIVIIIKFCFLIWFLLCIFYDSNLFYWGVLIWVIFLVWLIYKYKKNEL